MAVSLLMFLASVMVSLLSCSFAADAVQSPVRPALAGLPERL